MFVKEERIPISLDSEDKPYEERNVIYIKPKMDYGTVARVQDAAARVEVDSKGDAKATMEMLVGSYNVALLTENIVGWSGPAFEGVPCTADNIKRLDPDDPLVNRVLAEINVRNTRRKVDPKGL